MIAQFGSFRAAINAPPGMIERTANQSVSVILSAFNSGLECYLREKLAAKPVRATGSQFAEYLVATMGHLAHHETRILFLDKDGYLVRDETIESEWSPRGPVSCRDVVFRSLQYGAHSVVIARNRLGPANEISYSERAFAFRMKRIAHHLGIEIRDQLIVTGSECISLKESDAFPDAAVDEGLDEEMEHALEIVLRRLQYRRGSIPANEREQMVALAKDMYKSRRSRDRYFADLIDLGEPSWDLLIDLYVAGQEGKPISVSSACVAASVPTTTAMRRIQRLEDKGVLQREVDQEDGRRCNLVLSSKAQDAMERYLLALSTESGREYSTDVARKTALD